MTSKFITSECFKSIEGEGPYSGQTTIYIRFSKCNFTCGMFNNPDRIVDDKGYAPLGYDPADIISIADMDPVEIGCDTQYAVNPKFKHTWKHSSASELAKEVFSLLPTPSWQHTQSKQDTILSLTGGEPLLQWKIIPELLNQPEFDTLHTVLIETNCAVKFKDKFIDDLNDWIRSGPVDDEGFYVRKIVWSNSPKLSASGEPYNKAIVPEVAKRQLGVINCEQYFKFVCDNNDEHFDEIQQAMNDYYAGGIPENSRVLVMPMSCTEDQQINIMEAVADKCIERGYIFCLRVHNVVYANAIGK